MNIKRSLFPSLLVGTALALILRALGKRAAAKLVSDRDCYDEASPCEASYHEVDATVEAYMQRLNIPGVSLAIVKGDKIVHMRGFGRARPGGEAPTPQTLFFIGSLTKSVTALAVMQLVEAGKIELDAPVQRYLPWFRVADTRKSARTPALAPERSAGASITVRHLLNQTSGLPTWSGEIQLVDFDDSPGATERQARALATLELSRPAGSAFEYSNANYNLLGLIIEAASGESYADYIREHIFAPLDMRHSTASPAVAKQNGLAVANLAVANLAVGHQYWFAKPFAAPNIPIPLGSLPSGQLISSAEDMARYMMALLNEGRYGDVQILSGDGIAQLQRGVADFRAMGLSLGKYGMGWFVDEIGQTKLVWHSGTTPDFGAYMALLPEQKKGVVLLFNANHHWMSPVLSDFGAGVAALLAGEQPAPVAFVGMIPWALRGLLLIPALQIAGVVATLRLLLRWCQDPMSRPSGGLERGLYILLPLIPNLMLALTLRPMLGKRRGYLMLYMPDYAWIARICGSLALVWSQHGNTASFSNRSGCSQAQNA